MSTPSTKRAFTLIELLIVVAIIAILAAIAVPNLLEAQTRSKVSRVSADMRSYTVAMEAYHVDHNRYPIPSDVFARDIGDPIPRTDVSPFETRLPISLTTPVAYVTSLNTDPFATGRALESEVYHCTTHDYVTIRDENGSINWALTWFLFFRQLTGEPPPSNIGYYFMSFGPDRDHDADLPHTPGSTLPHFHGEAALYDPTNGTISSGDIFRFGPGRGRQP